MLQRLVRTLASAAVALTVLTIPAVASAHVNAEPADAADGATQVTFSFTHGCDQQPTSSLRIQIPDGTTDVIATNPEGWTSTVTATEITWTGTPIPNGTKSSFVATMKLTGKAGDTVFFPAVQACPGGAEEPWIDKSDDPEAANAAPRIVLAADSSPGTPEDHSGDEADHGTATSTTAPATTTSPGTTATAIATTPASSDEGPSGATLIYAAIVALIIVGGGGFALWKRSPSS